MKKRIQSARSSREQTPQSLLNLAGVNTAHDFGLDQSTDLDDAHAQLPIDQSDGFGSVDVAKRMVRWHAEALGRATEICGGNEM